MPTYKEQQIHDDDDDDDDDDTGQKQIKYYDYFDFQYEHIIFNCQLSHFSPCPTVPVLRHLVLS